ncbi:MAG: hypothetical protein IPK78_01890 [Rhodospirillales bacterium]|nr:hypothetical protein [Rhodospirillales bacterium]
MMGWRGKLAGGSGGCDITVGIAGDASRSALLPDRRKTMAVMDERRILEVGDGVLSGAAEGQKERARLGLDEIDREDQGVIVRITSPVVTSSFIRGFVGPSVRSLGFDEFVKKYEFHSTSSVNHNILANAQYAADLEE